MAMLAVRGLVRRFGGLLATDHVDLDLHANEIHAIIGPNGAGKTTLINQLSGELEPSEGQVLYDGLDVTDLSIVKRARLGIVRSYQITSVFKEFTALANVMMAVQAASGHSFSFWRPVARDPRLNEAAREMLALVGLADKEGVLVSELAHGAQRQLEIAMALALRPRVLLLDEPMAGMSPHESKEMIALLMKLKTSHAVLLVEHDMEAVFALADRITVLVYGRPIASGTPDQIRDHPDVRTAYLGEQEAVL